MDEAAAARAARRRSRAVAGDELQRAFKMLARVSKIMEQLVHAWDVLATMTPPEYSAIRPSLASSSGFQSWQYRCIEFMLGNKNAAMLKPHAHRPDLLAQVRGGARRALALRRGAAPAGAARPAGAGGPPRARLDRSPTSRATRVEQAWLVVYRDPEALLGPVPARRGADRPRGHVPALALPPRDDGRARHRLQARHRRHRRRQLPAQDARRRCCSPRSGSCAPISSGALSAPRAAPRERSRAGPGRRTSRRRRRRSARRRRRARPPPRSWR